MSMETCKLCNQESTPWFHINGHICQDCCMNCKGDELAALKEKYSKTIAFVHQVINVPFKYNRADVDLGIIQENARQLLDGIEE